jgi:DNA-binding GntR family transcriptional regulator
MTTLLQRSDLRSQAKAVILDRIASGEYAPGERLVETRIALELGTSQTPVREALRDLEQLGLVEHEPHRGCSVREVTAAELRAAYPVRAALEALAAREAATRITEAELAQLDDRYAAMVAAADARDPLEQSRANVEFHGGIVRAAGNPVLERLWAQLEPLARTYLASVQPRADLRNLARRHLPILEALRARDGEKAAAELERHLADAARLLEEPE